MLLLHSFFNILILLLKILNLFVGLSQLLLVQSHMHILVSFHLLMLAASPVELKLQVSVLNDKIVAFVLKVLQLKGIMLLSFQKILKFLFQSNFHLSSVFSILIKNLFKVTDNILFRKVINSICFVHVKCVYIRWPFNSISTFYERSSCH